MPDDTNREGGPRFTHVSINTSSVPSTTTYDDGDEEVLVIGAVDEFKAPLSVGEADTGAGDEPAAAGERPRNQDATGETRHDEGTGAQQDEDDAFGGPMPLAQKLVIMAALVGLIVVVAFLVWFWVFR
ncbi:MAG: hypothetical protein LBH64_04820 [Coriobacteriales bacterium]|jgi:hypothetical protein|nr:hypothetical protein [Coriobacteriales bacterium]